MRKEYTERSRPGWLPLSEHALPEVHEGCFNDYLKGACKGGVSQEKLKEEGIKRAHYSMHYVEGAQVCTAKFGEGDFRMAVHMKMEQWVVSLFCLVFFSLLNCHN